MPPATPTARWNRGLGRGVGSADFACTPESTILGGTAPTAIGVQALPAYDPLASSFNASCRVNNSRAPSHDAALIEQIVACCTNRKNQKMRRLWRLFRRPSPGAFFTGWGRRV